MLGDRLGRVPPLGIDLGRATLAIRRYGHRGTVFDASTYPDHVLDWAAATVDRWSPV